MFYRYLITVVCLMAMGNGFAQVPNLELTLRYNLSLTRYEAFARPDATLSGFNWGPSQITVVAPASVVDAAFVVTPVAAGAWQDNSRIYAPSSAPGSDFHAVGALGAQVSLSAGVELLLFHFTIPGGGCTPGLRLFINGVDPNSSAPGMNGGDFTNTVFAIVPAMPGGYEAYIGNYENNGSVCTPLPLVLTTWSANDEKDAVALHWETEQERNFDYFLLERSEDGLHFLPLAEINGKMGLQKNSYDYTDRQVKKGVIYYYRLKMTDIDGSFTWSDQRTARVAGPEILLVSIAPNPVISAFRVMLDATQESAALITLHDISGRVVENRKVEIVEGRNGFVFDLYNAESGVYLLTIETEHERMTRKIIKSD